MFPAANGDGPNLVSNERSAGAQPQLRNYQRERLRRTENNDGANCEGAAKSTSAARYDSSHQVSEASDFLRQELNTSTELSQDRYSVLKAAVEFVNRISQPGNTSQEPAYRGDSGTDSNRLPRPFSPEIFYMMTIGM